MSPTAVGNAYVSLETYGGNVWVFYGDTANLSGALPGPAKLVFKKGVAPFGSGNFDFTPTPVVSYHTVYDKVWRYFSSAYSDVTTAAGNNTAADVSMVTGVGDALYFGKIAKYDTVSWALSTNGIGGQTIWEYWNGTAWNAINTYISVSAPAFTAASGCISFVPNSDWVPIAVNGEATPYYYVRARVTRLYTTPPIGTQMVAFPQINWASVTASSNFLRVMWTESSAFPMRIRYSTVEFPNNPDSPSSLGPTNVVSGTALSNNKPSFQFNLSDPNLLDATQYRIQISTSSSFINPAVDFTSGLASPSATTFTVGQAAGTGTYTVGSAGQTLPEAPYYWRVMAKDQGGLTSSWAVANGGAMAVIVDVTNPASNASNISLSVSEGGTSVPALGWTRGSLPYFSWSDGADTASGSGLLGYCLYLGQTASANPLSTKGLLGTSPVTPTNGNCQYIVATSSANFADNATHGVQWLTDSTSPYYLNIKAIDKAGNMYPTSAQFEFYYDGTAPTNVGYISPASGNFSNIVDMSFSWPSPPTQLASASGSVSNDFTSGVLGWQYQFNSTTGHWQGTTHSDALNMDYIPATASAYIPVPSRDGSYISVGANIINFRTIDVAGNNSTDGTIRTGTIYYAGQAPTFGNFDKVTVTPAINTANSFGLSWPAASPATSQNIGAYYYMINTPPPLTYATLTGNRATYFNNGTLQDLSEDSLPNVNRGANTVYVVAVDDAHPANYSPSNYITGTFTLDSSDPDNVENLVLSDASIKYQQKWNVAITWTAPVYLGAGNVTYLIYRSADGVTFTQVGATIGLSYVDSTPLSAPYYYKIYTQDGAHAISSGTNAETITPTGRWTAPPTLEAAPLVTGITTKKATVTWGTNRTADSKVQFGTSAGAYNAEQPSNSDQVASHTINLTNLSPGTVYYFKVLWTDEDGNTGFSSEYTFTTAAAPFASSIKVNNISISSAYVSFSVVNASKATVEYGKTETYGIAESVSTSASGSTYTVALNNLSDGTVYHMRVTTQDADGNKYSGDDYTFTTLPIPKFTSTVVQKVAGFPAPALRVVWLSNTPVNSVVTYYMTDKPDTAKDQIDLILRKNHEMLLKNLRESTSYTIIVKGKDVAGNAATQETKTVTTLADLTPPQMLNLTVESTIAGVGADAKAQITVTWDTDKASSTQVEYAQGTGTTYGQSTQEDTNKTMNHAVTITGLTPSKIYHLRANSKDTAGNLGQSLDTVVITPSYTEDALSLVVGNMSQIFGFLKTVNQ